MTQHDSAAERARVKPCQDGCGQLTTSEDGYVPGHKMFKPKPTDFVNERSNPFREGARRTKADMLIVLFKKYRYTLELLERMTDKDWAVASEAAGVNVPGKQTREMVKGAFTK